MKRALITLACLLATVGAAAANSCLMMGEQFNDWTRSFPYDWQKGSYSYKSVYKLKIQCDDGGELECDNCVRHWLAEERLSNITQTYDWFWTKDDTLNVIRPECGTNEVHESHFAAPINIGSDYKEWVRIYDMGCVIADMHDPVRTDTDYFWAMPD